MNRLLCFALLVCVSIGLNAQEPGKPVTNSDVVSMTKAGLKHQTIVLAVEQGPTAFDTSPLGLVALKKAGVSDSVLNAMLKASKSSHVDAVPTTSASTSPSGWPSGQREGLSLFQKAVTTAGDAAKVVVIPQPAYAINAQGRTDLPATIAEDFRASLKFSLPYIAQHMSEFTFSTDGQEMIDTEKCDRLRIKHNEGEAILSIDLGGKVRRDVLRVPMGTVTTDNSDFRWADGVSIPFRFHSTRNGVVTDSAVKRYRINPGRYEMDSALFSSSGQQTVENAGSSVSGQTQPVTASPAADERKQEAFQKATDDREDCRTRSENEYETKMTQLVRWRWRL